MLRACLEASRAHLKPGLEALQLCDGAVGAAIHVAGQQAAVVVGKAQESLVHAFQRQLLAPALAGAPVAALAVPVHLHAGSNGDGCRAQQCSSVGKTRFGNVHAHALPSGGSLHWHLLVRRQSPRRCLACMRCIESGQLKPVVLCRGAFG